MCDPVPHREISFVLNLHLPSSNMASIATTLQFLTVPAVKKHTATVIFVHGLGDTGYGWQPVAGMFSKETSLGHVKWVLPHSPQSPVTANMCMVMPSWFDIKSFGFKDVEDEAGMLKSKASLTELIDAELAAGIPSNRIILGGFSQGAAMSLLTGLSFEKQLAGIVCLSGWVPIKDTLHKMLAPYAKRLPIFWGHGSNDPLVQPRLAEESVEFLKSIGILDAKPNELAGLSYNVYPGVGHSTNMQELEDLKGWIAKVIPEQS
ncbi:Phospholipase/carboxylesterase/thioesterase [Lentinula raphanica]|uniref:Acyl-protein thioesterase 1 n=1 Tax=Lentinula raphanica TaxID=153919 RepID=A0AA38UHI3_9AGAR|nr:Phospholipase/carboxylesterase/thioesterase [Lentinula raphanica]